MGERKKRSGGRAGRQAERQKPIALTTPYIKRKINVSTLLDEENLVNWAQSVGGDLEI